MNHILKNAAIGITMILLGCLLLYIGFIKDYLAMIGGEIDSMRYQMRALLVPAFIVVGALTIIMQPDYSGFGPWKNATEKSKRFILLSMFLSFILSAAFFLFTLSLQANNKSFDTKQNTQNNEEAIAEIRRLMIEKSFKQQDIETEMINLRQSVSSATEESAQQIYQNYLQALQ
jgi:hypothetical protein